MKTIAGSLAACVLMAGCGTSSPPPKPDTRADARSGKAKQSAQGWIGAYKDWNADKDLAAVLAQPENRPARDLLASAQCMDPAPRGKAAAASPAAFLVSASRNVFAAPREPERADGTSPKRDTIDATSVDVSFPTAGFRGIRCAVFARYADGDAPTRPGLLAVLGIEQKFEEGKYTDYFRFRPLLVRAGNAIVRTGDGNATIAVSMALVARQLVVSSTGAASFAELGAAAVSVPRVPVGGESVACAQASACAGMSAPIPVPVARGTVAVSIGVSEAGGAGAEIDQNAAELAAVKAALGPAAPVLPGRAPDRR